MAEPLSLGSNNDNDKDNDSDNGSVEALSKKRRFDHTVPISPEVQGEDRLSKAGITSPLVPLGSGAAPWEELVAALGGYGHLAGCRAGHSELNLRHVFTPEELSVF